MLIVELWTRYSMFLVWGDLCTFENRDGSTWSMTVEYPFLYRDKCLAKCGSESSRKNWVFALVQALGTVSGGLGTALLCQGTLRVSDVASAQPAVTDEQCWRLPWVFNSQALISPTRNYGNSKKILQHKGDVALPNFKRRWEHFNFPTELLSITLSLNIWYATGKKVIVRVNWAYL